METVSRILNYEKPQIIRLIYNKNLNNYRLFYRRGNRWITPQAKNKELICQMYYGILLFGWTLLRNKWYVTVKSGSLIALYFRWKKNVIEYYLIFKRSSVLWIILNGSDNW